MKLLRIIGHLFVFFALGEALVRLDREGNFFRGQARLANERNRSELLEMIDAGTFKAEAGQPRIMLVGDSLLYGAGIPQEQRVGRRLQEMLEKQSPGGKPVLFLDVTRPGNNTLQNKLDMLRYAPAFQPQVVLLAYNANDVYGDQGVQPAAGVAPPAQQNPQRKSSGDKKLDLVANIRRALYQSKLLEFAMQNINMELKLSGFVVPGSEFDHQLNKSHEESFPGWRTSQCHLKEMSEFAARNDIHLIVLNMPELNMLKSYEIFGKLNTTIAEFFRKQPVEFIEMSVPFMEKGEADYASSRYDGHPNGAAHKVVADTVLPRISRHLNSKLAHPDVPPVKPERSKERVH